MATQNVQINVSQTGAVSVKNDIAGIGQAAGSAATPVQQLTNAINDNAHAHAGLSGQAMAMQHSLRSAVEQIAQGVPITQILGQQVGHLSYAMSGEGGLAGAAKALGSSLAGLLSPINLLGIGLFGLAIVGLQSINWMNLFRQAGIYVITFLQQFLAILPQITPLLVAIGAALLATFGPAALSAVYALTSAIYTGLIGALAALFTLILSNPITIFIAALAYAIVKVNGLQNTIQQIIQQFGILIETIGRVKEAFGGLGDITATGIKIQVDAKQAAADLTSSFNSMSTKLTQALASGKDYLIEGGAKAAPLLTNGMVAGGKAASDILKAGTAQAAQAAYQFLNGVPQQVQGAIQAGADYTYNQVTGAYEKSAATASTSVKSAMEVGGNSAATSVKQALTTGGQSAAQSLTLAGQTVSGNIAEVLQTKALEIARLITVTMQAQLAQIQATAAKDRADARATLAGLGGSGSSGGSRGSSGVGNAANSNSIGSGAIGGGYVGGGLPAGDIGSSSGGSGATSTSTSLNIINQVDPAGQIAAINSAQGNKTVVNIIKVNAAEIKAALGIY